MTDKGMKWCAYSGPIFCILFGVGLIGSGLFPPLAPSANAQEIANFFSQNTTQVRFGVIIMMLSVGFFIAYMGGVAAQMKMMGSPSPSLIYTFVISSAILGIVLFNVVDYWAQAAFRPERAAESVQLMNDLAYTMLIWNPILPMVLFISIGLAAHIDTRPKPVFPRWYPYYCYWAALASLGGTVLISFHKGPFAWDGLLGLWVPAIALFGWLGITAILVVKNAISPDLYTKN